METASPHEGKKPPWIPSVLLRADAPAPEPAGCNVGWESWGAVWDFQEYEGSKEGKGGAVYGCSHIT